MNAAAIPLCLSLALAGADAASPDPVPPNPEPSLDPLGEIAPGSTSDDREHRFLLIPMPLLGYNSDEGIGAGAVLSLHHRTKGTDILRNEVSFRLFGTTSLVQRHELRWEGVDVLGLPLRIWARVGYFSTLTQPYCGRGNAVSCDESIPAAIAQARGYEEGSAQHDSFVRRFYTMRYIRPHADTLLRWRVTDKPQRTEVFGGWRLSWHIPGTLFERGPYPSSLYARIHPDGEAGIASVPQLGVTYDTRDFEPSPSSGVFVEASVRASHPWLGSKWTWAGTNVTGHLYETLLPSPHLVWAGRLMVDLMAGDAATEDILQIGGTRNFGAFGGQWIGRGVRDRRYLGKIKVVHQSELRLDVYGFEIFGIRIESGVVGFGDVGFIGWDWDDLSGGLEGQPYPAGNPVGLVYSFGVGLRFLVNRGVVAQAQMAGSPLEARSPAFYTPVGNSW
jgi:Omp85 superfamily domain